jgi:hypothetical protein
MLLSCAVLVMALLFSAGLILWRRGYRLMNGDDEGTGVGQALALVGFCAGGVVLLFEWHHWKQLPLLFFFFLFAIAVGAFQLGLMSQGLANGYIRATGDEGDGVAATSLYTLLIMPSGEAISRNDRPVRFWLEIILRAAVGVGMVLFPTLARIYGPR